MWRDFAVTVAALAAISGTTLFVFGRRAGHDPSSGVARYIEQASPNAVTSVLFGLAVRGGPGRVPLLAGRHSRRGHHQHVRGRAGHQDRVRTAAADLAGSAG